MFELSSTSDESAGRLAEFCEPSVSRAAGPPGSRHTTSNPKPLTPGQRIAALIATLEGLVQAGELTADRAARLIDKLTVGRRHLEMGRTAKAVHMLELFIKQVQGYVRDGVVSTSDGETLVVAANVIIDELS